ncbi:MAG: hypothetical protein DRP64_01275 [Verrucomicrobia bacterium]|nr:MAG: hypothetical protein DRP64_01275 [Verrucomicrobiota bacterium]
MSKTIKFIMLLFVGGILMEAPDTKSQEGYYAFPEESPEAKYVPPLKEGQTEVEYYRSELADLYKLDDFKAKKNSYVLGLEAMCMLPRKIPTGGRYTLLDVEGQGSLRHIWETRGPETATFEFEMFVDGEKTPSIKGSFPDLIAAAQRAKQPYVLNPGGTIPKLSHNFYLPVPFEKSLKIDIANFKDDNGLVFLQLDYRLEDDSMKGVKLQQKGKDSQITLAYKPDSLVEATSSSLSLQNGSPGEKATRTSLLRTIKTIKGNGEFTLEGPAIIRKLAVNNTRAGVRMNVFFDDETTPAVEVDIADFYGSFKGTAFGDKACYLPMPFAENMRVVVFGATDQDEWNFEIEAEPVQAFETDWGYFHARSDHLFGASGYDQFQILNTTGRGKWLGMSLYNTQHDHGGGDFAIIDGGTADPSFLHGINGEDYFSFAFFGKGENFPYSEAFSNEEGRMRLHLENPYVFNESINISWGVTKGVNPRSVAYWYQQGAKSNVLSAEQSRGLKWKVFGPVDVPLLADGNTPDVSDSENLFAALPAEADLDAGKPFDAYHIMFTKTNTGTFNGWAEQYAVGGHLNLMYIYGHAMELNDHMHMGYYARCMMAKTEFSVGKAQRVKLQLSYDDPLVVEVNGKKVFEDMELRRGFTTQTCDAVLREGDNKVVVKMLDTPNNNTCWAGISLRVLDAQGNRIELSQ